jgi:superfamily I DNA/RNA helicase
MADVDFQKMPAEMFDRDSAILCRNTKPLVELAFHLIRRRIACHVEGREIGQGLLRLAARWKTVSTIAELRVKLQDHLEAQTERLLAKKQEAKLQDLTDQIETLFVFMEALADDDGIQALRTEIEKVFADSPAAGITLSTIHKAKGREWNRVYWYGRNRWQPSRFARQDWQVEQETNLMYVACTRAKRTLVEIEVPFPPRD